MELNQIVYISIVALFTSLLMVPFLHRWAVANGAVDLPDQRKVHRKAVPRIGGVAICVAWLFTLVVCVNLSWQIRGVMAGALIVFVTGLIDDLYGLSAKRKFLGEVIACMVTITVGRVCIHHFGDLFGFGPVILPIWVAIPFTIFAVVGAVNAINLMDGLDGLAGGISTIALVSFLVLGYHTGNYPVVCLCAALLGAVLGFLKYNLFPARIFMGDAGSLTLGFIIAMLAVLLIQSPESGINPAVPLLVLALPIADTVRVIGRRLLNGKSPFKPDMSHVHHKFLDLGFKHRFTVVIIYGCSLFWATFATLCHKWSEPLLLGVYVAGMFFFYQAIRCLRNLPKRLDFLGMDSAEGIRDSATFRRLSRLAEGMTSVLLALTLAYLFLAAFFSSTVDKVTAQTGSFLLCGCLALFFIVRDIRNHFAMAMLAVAILPITFTMNRNNDHMLIHGLSVGLLMNGILAGISLLVLFRFVFRNRKEPFFTSIDYLLIAIGVFALIISPQFFPAIRVSGALANGILLYLALKLSVRHGIIPASITISSELVALMTIVVRGL